MSQYEWPSRLLVCLSLLACGKADDSVQHSNLGTDAAASPGRGDAGGERDADPAGEDVGDADAAVAADADSGPNCPGADAAPRAPCSSCCCAFTCSFCTIPAASTCAGSSDSAKYSFESDTQGWVLADATNKSIAGKTSVTGAQAFAGEESLAAQMSIPAGSEEYVRFQFPPVAPGPQATVTFNVWLPPGAGLQAIQPYVMDATYAWNGSYVDAGELVLGCWATVTLRLPENFQTPAAEIGVEFFASTGAAYDGTAYIDSVSW